MSKPSDRARYTLPDVVNPSDTVCFVVPCPNDKFHIAAFKGQLMALGRAYSWQNDAAHTALDVANVWRDIFNNLENCELVNIRLKPTDFCVLQLTLDGGVTWADVADLSGCAHAAAVDEIQAARDRGDLAGGGQQPGIGSGSPGVCYDYDITLTGNQRWISPVAVEAGDIITVSNERGAWFDGNLLSLQWNCADGTPYSLGTCTGSPHTDSGDPLPTLDHMRLIGNLPADGTTPYFDMYNTAYTIPTGVVLGDFFLQANDGTLSDNQGSISLHVQICKSLWTHVFDFTVSDGGFSVANPTYTCHWVSGTGWQTTSTEPGMDIRLVCPSGVYGIISVQSEFTWTKAGGDYLAAVEYVQTSPPVTYMVDSGVPADGTQTQFASGTGPAQKTLVIVVIPGHAGTATTTRLTVRGTGTDPF